MTADVLASIADNLAGLELSRLRWAQDKKMGRPQLTFDGEPAVVPSRLSEDDRTAVSFLLEEDRARALSLRSPIVNAQQVLARHVVPGGPTVNALRLDYLVAWLVDGSAVDHRQLADEIEVLEHTPGARLTNKTSDLIHEAVAGPAERRNPDRYDQTGPGRAPLQEGRPRRHGHRAGGRTRPRPSATSTALSRATPRRCGAGGYSCTRRTWSGSAAPTATGATPSSTLSRPTQSAATSCSRWPTRRQRRTSRPTPVRGRSRSPTSSR